MAEQEGIGSAAAQRKQHRDEETQGLEKVSDYVEEVDTAPELGQVSLLCIVSHHIMYRLIDSHNYTCTCN